MYRSQSFTDKERDSFVAWPEAIPTPSSDPPQAKTTNQTAAKALLYSLPRIFFIFVHIKAKRILKIVFLSWF